MDDEKDVRKTMADTLTKLGYEVVQAEDGARAVALYREALNSGSRFDGVIMDLTVPGGMGGKEAMRQLREIDPEVKAVVSSGYSNDPIMADYRTYGFRGVAAKPFRIKELGEAIHKLLNGTDQP